MHRPSAVRRRCPYCKSPHSGDCFRQAFDAAHDLLRSLCTDDGRHANGKLWTEEEHIELGKVWTADQRARRGKARIAKVRAASPCAAQFTAIADSGAEVHTSTTARGAVFHSPATVSGVTGAKLSTTVRCHQRITLLNTGGHPGLTVRALDTIVSDQLPTLLSAGKLVRDNPISMLLSHDPSAPEGIRCTIHDPLPLSSLPPVLLSVAVRNGVPLLDCIEDSRSKTPSPSTMTRRALKTFP